MKNNAAQEKKEKEDIAKRCYEDGSAEINGRSYKYHEVSYKKGLKIVGYASKIQHLLVRGDLSFLGSDEQQDIEKLMFSNITYNDSRLSNIDNHFEKYRDDYIKLFTVSLSVFAYPFMSGSH